MKVNSQLKIFSIVNSQATIHTSLIYAVNVVKEISAIKLDIVKSMQYTLINFFSQNGSSILTAVIDGSRDITRFLNILILFSQLHHWKSKLPLEPVMKLLEILVPQVDKMCKEK